MFIYNDAMKYLSSIFKNSAPGESYIQKKKFLKHFKIIEDGLEKVDQNDKKTWVDIGFAQEIIFLCEAKNAGCDLIKFNSEKNENFCELDFLVSESLFGGSADKWIPTDYKCRTVPFYMSERKYGVDPRLEISLNVNKN